jgi:hypothetical protein
VPANASGSDPGFLVVRHHDRVVCRCDPEDFVIGDAGLRLRDVRDIVALGSQGVDDRPFDPLVAHEPRETYVGIG